MDFLYSIDVAVFTFINQTLSNPVGDLLWPLITDYDKLLPVRIVLVAVWLWLIVKGGRQGRVAALMIIPVLFLSDKLSSAVIKEIVERPRPCHEPDLIPYIHQLAPCGPGKSFPSSHAVNNFAVATVFSFFYRKWAWALFTWGGLVALSRPAVGAHYPSDILAGAVIGLGVAAALIWTWTEVEQRFFPAKAPESPEMHKVTSP